MKKIYTLLTLVLISGASLLAKTVNSITISDGGPGPYKAIVVEDDGLKGFSIIRPKDLASAAAEGKLPVIIWGNGGCSRDSWWFLPYLTNIASHGYVIITNGKWTEGPDAKQVAEAQAAAKTQQAQQTQQGAKAEAVHSPSGGDGKRADALELVEALNWLEKQAKTRKSEYYKVVDTDNVCASGQSCGGLQALVMSTIGDFRFKTALLNNTGIFNDQGGEMEYLLPKADLKKLVFPVLYVIGGPTDIAYPNAVDDFERIDNVPVTIAQLPVGHGGTFAQKDGGQFAALGLLWLDYQLKGKTGNEKVFRYCQVPEGLDFELDSKNY